MRKPVRLIAALLVLVGALGLVTVAPTAVAKKGHHKKHKKPGGGTFTSTSPVVVPAASTVFPFASGRAVSTITVPKKKKTSIRDVNVGVRLNVNAPTFTTAGLSLKLVAPNGQTEDLLFGFDTGGPGTAGTGLGNGPANCSSGTTQFDDQAHRQFFSASPPGATTDPEDPYAPTFTPDPSSTEFTAFPPYVGAVQPDGLLAPLKGDQAKGTWTLVLLNADAPDTATLLCWQLQVKPQKPKGVSA
jgi:hypothetical protein